MSGRQAAENQSRWCSKRKERNGQESKAESVKGGRAKKTTNEWVTEEDSE
jgi:hypothetical protein